MTADFRHLLEAKASFMASSRDYEGCSKAIIGVPMDATQLVFALAPDWHLTGCEKYRKVLKNTVFIRINPLDEIEFL